MRNINRRSDLYILDPPQMVIHFNLLESDPLCYSSQPDMLQNVIAIIRVSY
jgi:hypothetical protein